MTNETIRPAVLAIQSMDSGEVRTLFQAVTARFRAAGIHVIGSIEQVPPESVDGKAMLLDLGSGNLHQLFQSLGSGSGGCSLDTEGLANACAQVEQAIAARVAAGGTAADTLVILSKYGHQEETGRGFISAFQAAVSGGLSVLTSLSPSVCGTFQDFVGDMAVIAPARMQSVEDWWHPDIPPASKAGMAEAG